jgi:hypothetical protein
MEYMRWYAYKEETRRYLEELNKQQTVIAHNSKTRTHLNYNQQVLEYTLFQPGLFINYLTTPFKSAAHLHQTELPFDFNNRRAIVPENYDQIYVTLTKVQDLAQVVARAISFEGKWPVVGGVKGTDISLGQIISVGEKVRGMSPDDSYNLAQLTPELGGQPFQIEKVKPRDLESGAWSASWLPRISHPAIPPELVSDTLSKTVVSGILLGISAGCFKVSDEWNRLLPDYEFTTAEDFLTEAWTGKP